MLLPNEKVCCYMPGEEPEYYGEPVEIAEDEGKDYCAYVYNIEVEDTHTYFVGAAGIWVHNCGGAAGRECITRQLSLQHIQTLLPATKQYWLDAGASSEVLDLAQFSVADFSTIVKNRLKNDETWMCRYRNPSWQTTERPRHTRTVRTSS